MLSIDFLNVGKGSCTVIDFPSRRLSMIDIDRSTAGDEDSLTDPLEYLKAQYPGRELFRFVLTHPDMDHMCGLKELSRQVSVLNFWDTDNNKVINDEEWTDSPWDPDDWKTYQEWRSQSDNPRCLRLKRNATSNCCWVQDGITVLSPSESLVELGNETQEYNHLSYVLMVESAGIRVLLGGDATVEAWDEILTNCGPGALKADIFLAPHHGSKNNVHDDAFLAVAPDYVVVSVAEGVDYDYDYYSRLANKGVLSTKYYGTISVKASGIKSSFRCKIPPVDDSRDQAACFSGSLIRPGSHTAGPALHRQYSSISKYR